MSFVFSNTLSLFLLCAIPSLHLTQLKVVKVVGVPPAYPPILMANPLPLLLHTWLLPGISTYQVGHGCKAWAVTFHFFFNIFCLQHSFFFFFLFWRLSLVTQRWIACWVVMSYQIKFTGTKQAPVPAVSLSQKSKIKWRNTKVCVGLTANNTDTKRRSIVSLTCPKLFNLPKCDYYMKSSLGDVCECNVFVCSKCWFMFANKCFFFSSGTCICIKGHYCLGYGVVNFL